VPIAKKAVDAPIDDNVTGIPPGRVQSRRLPAMPGTAWPWPRAVMAIFLLSLLLWGGVVAIASIAFD
jgi:hypothetical protein